jgi:hypothetical protein
LYCEDLRSCYSTAVKPFRDSDDQYTIQWYFVDEGTPPLPFGSAFTSNVWMDTPETDQSIGEVAGAPRVWADGSPPFPVAGNGHFCGTEEDFQLGGLVENRNPDLNVFGGLACCPPPPSPFVFFSCPDFPRGAWDTWTLFVAGAIGPWAPSNGTFTLRFVGNLPAWPACNWVSDQSFNLPGITPFPTFWAIQKDIPPLSFEVQLYTPTVGYGHHFEIQPWDGRSPVFHAPLVNPPPVPRPALAVSLLPGFASVPGQFCIRQGAFMPTNLLVRVAGAGGGILTEIIDQTIPVRQVTGCLYRGVCWFVNAVLRFRVTLGTTCEIRFIDGGVIEFAGISTRGVPFFYSATPPIPWDGRPIALMLDQPVPFALGLPQSITLFIPSENPP